MGTTFDSRGHDVNTTGQHLVSEAASMGFDVVRITWR